MSRVSHGCNWRALGSCQSNEESVSRPSCKNIRKVGWWAGFKKHTPSGAAALAVLIS